MPIVTPLYAAPLVALYLVLTFRAIFRRGATNITLGTGADDELLSRVRAHANCAEYMPLGLLLLAMIELQGAPLWLLHLTGLLLLAGRGLHAFGVSRTPQVLPARIAGMVLTVGALAVAAVGGLVLAL